MLSRITSTHVENTFSPGSKFTQYQDHLHTRGEYRINHVFCVRFQGSPPHTWRIHPQFYTKAFDVRITSTHVENTLVRSFVGVPSWDHLHTRGEYDTSTYLDDELGGSPPHTWRIHLETSVYFDNYRITSTHVENTHSVVLSARTCKDHLHTRGEYREEL